MIEFRDVSFRYPNSADGGLEKINLTVPDGQFKRMFRPLIVPVAV